MAKHKVCLYFTNNDPIDIPRDFTSVKEAEMYLLDRGYEKVKRWGDWYYHKNDVSIMIVREY